MPTNIDEQTVVVHDASTGEVVAVAFGTELGARRTGALGGLAAKTLTGGTIHHLAIIGAGRQAWTQLWAISAFARPNQISVYSPNPARRNEFSQRAVTELGLTVTTCSEAREAVTGADMVVLATNSSTPVIDTNWLLPDVVVTTMGPKQVGRAEFPPDLVTQAAFAVTDSIDQLRPTGPRRRN
jgi:alanine dehydrogenase